MSILESAGGLIDSFADAVSPSWGTKRRAHRLTREMLDVTTKAVKDNEFKQERVGRLRQRGFKQNESNASRSDRAITEDVSINEMLETELRELQTRTAGIYSENSIAHSVVENRVTYEVGSGLKLKASVTESRLVSAEQARKINRAIDSKMRCWSLHGVDKSRMWSFALSQRLMVREFANYGECFMLLGESPFAASKGVHAGPLPTAIEFISPMRVSTPFKFWNDPNVRMGVRYKKKQVVGYYVESSASDDNGTDEAQDFTYYPRFDAAGNPRMVHVFEPMFAGQSRGIPYLAAAYNKILDFDDYLEAEIIGKQVEACFGLIFKVKPQDPSSTYYDLALANAETRTDPNEQLMEQINPGFIQRVGQDDDVVKVDPARPGSNFAPFLEGTLRMVAAASGQPYELIAKNFHGVTYSSGKLSMNDGEMGFSMRRKTLVDCGLTPIYRRVISDAVFADEMSGTIPIENYIQEPDAYCEFTVQAKKIGEIDEVKAANAFKIKREQGISNKADYHDEQGNDLEAQEDQRYHEKRREIDDRLALEKYEMEQRKSLGLPESNPENEGDDSEENEGDEKKKPQPQAA